MSRTRDIIALSVISTLFAAANAWLLISGRIEADASGVGIIVAAGITLIMYSLLYKDNPLFKAVENLYVGVGLGYTVVIGWFHFLKPDVLDALVKPAIESLSRQPDKAPQWSLLVPSIMGMFMLLRVSQRLSWLSRWSYAFIMGAGAGMSIPLTVSSYMLKQSWQTMAPLLDRTNPAAPSIEINAALILVGVIAVLCYFFFSVEHRGPIGVASRAGVCYLMISFGASFGFTVMARVSLLIGRFQFLMGNWLHVIE